MTKKNGSVKSKRSQKKSSTAGKSTTGTRKGKTSGYIYFCQEERRQRKDEFGSIPPKDVIRELGKAWRKLSPQQQETYKSKAAGHTTDSSSSKSQSHKRTAPAPPPPQQSDLLSSSKTNQSAKHQSATKKKGEHSAS